MQVYQTQQQIERLEKQHALHERQNSEAASSQQEQSPADAQSQSSNGLAGQHGSEHPQADAAEQVCVCVFLHMLMQSRTITCQQSSK